MKPAGLPTEAALRVLVEKMGRYDPARPRLGDAVDAYNQHLLKGRQVQLSLEFSRDRKAMSVVQDKQLLIKGAPDFLLENAKFVLNKAGKPVELSASLKQKIANEIKALATEGLRTLAFAYKEDLGELEGY